MGWLYVPDTGESSWGSSSCSEDTTAPPATSSAIPCRPACCASESETECCAAHPYGTTSEPLTGDRGRDGSTSLRPDSPASRSRPPPAGATCSSHSGRKCCASCASANHHSCSWRTSVALATICGAWSCQTSSETGIPSWVLRCSPPPTWVPRTPGGGFSYLPTPTAKGNAGAPSMLKWPSSRALMATLGNWSLDAVEWLMGLPENWLTHSDGRPETESFHSWQASHSRYLRALLSASL